VFVGKDAILVNLQVAVLEDALRTRLRPGTVRGSTGGLDPSLWIISIEGFAAAAAMTSLGGRASKECREVGGGRRELGVVLICGVDMCRGRNLAGRLECAEGWRFWKQD
jgi:hypothetical protein